MQVQNFLLLPMALLLPPRAQGGEIIGGRKAKPHSRPYMAYLERKLSNGKEQRCGGFLVREDVVLTAAHCAAREITVVLGAHDISQEEETQQRISVQQQIPHPDYDNKSFVNDLMLLQLEEPVELTDAVGTINLPRARQQVDPGSLCSVAGWGRTSLYKTTSILHEVELEVMSNKTCLADEFIQSRYKPSHMMCVGDPDENKASFWGDSGGPLVCAGTAEGIVSFGKKNGSPPRVFTRISTYITWIKSKLRRLRRRGTAL
ncbi:mast cell protease 3-like [Carettochelys insculpta]|uniref:mast cell protease 3-like n=1 Tax=Carettochelys insculpta TaxID=44489 RepID=UPI003EC0CCD3